LVAAEKGLQKLMTTVDLLDKIELPDGSPETEASEDKEILDACKQCQDSMNDDFNTAQVLAALFELASKINAIHNKQLDAGKVSKSAFDKMKNTMNDFVFDILGLQPISKSKDGKTEELVNLLIEIRSEARENKDFATSDKIRDDLQEIGIRLKDEKDGKTTFEIDG
jgi:cysteinyl-tRNA synthetase